MMARRIVESCACTYYNFKKHVPVFFEQIWLNFHKMLSCISSASWIYAL